MPNTLNTFLLFSLPLVVPGLAADGVIYMDVLGQGFYPSKPDNYTLGLFSHAEKTPNVTRSIKFNPFVAPEGNTNITNLTDIEWTWRVNVSDFSVPNAAAGRDPLNDPHIVHTTYDFTWPEGGNLSSALPPSTNAVCIQWLDVIGNPANISNTYTEDNADSTDCTPMLGRECVDAIVARASGHRSDCFNIAQSWWSIRQCASTFGYILNANNGNLGTQEGAIYSTEGSDSISGERFWAATSAAYNGTNTTTYNSAANKLQVMMLAPVILNVTYPQLLCTRVNTTHLEESESDGDGNRDNEGEGDDNDEGAGSLVRHNSGIAILASLVWVLVAMF
ncbi:hypothetical protein F5B22DRAFT_618522 [Xylaria bambusicola]|uniref:uncharacterized protein n=1 Tax=Xylaria bambusicola TaxID=326684 RepID=UPI00200813CB|nr:uncharacterized protein F5B22DRAFT_618522 [Xylaria bambusicola]KAI0509117.1 hypothetical protein F5B22DRAFT_618522 [Xylaria bambusicola]